MHTYIHLCNVFRQNARSDWFVYDHMHVRTYADLY